MTDLIDAPAKVINRDRWGRPLVPPPDGGKPIAYTRCTTFVGCLEDTFNLQQWEKRMVALGLASRPDLLLAVSANSDMGDDKQKAELTTITNSAKEAAKASAAATTGTALHALTERIDRGQRVGPIPQAYLADLDAYRAATAELDPVLIEQFCVLDSLKIGGTPDRVVLYQGRGYIADVKTGGVDYGAGKIAMQLSVYARSLIYNVETQQRQDFPVPVDTHRGIVIHLPAGTGQCELRWVDLDAGWDAVLLARQVRAWRARRDLYTPWQETAVADADVPEDATSAALDAIGSASSLTHLRRVYTELVLAGFEEKLILAACLARKVELGGVA